MRNLVMAVLLPAAAVAMAGCSHPATTPGQATGTTPTTGKNAAPAACNRLDVAALSRAIGENVTLDAARSTAPASSDKNQKTSSCVFVSQAKGASGSDVGTIQLVTYASAAAATQAVNQGLSTASQLGLPVSTSASGGVRVYAQAVPDGWTCAEVSGVEAVEATVATGTSGPACAWARIGLQALGH